MIWKKKDVQRSLRMKYIIYILGTTTKPIVWRNIDQIKKTFWLKGLFKLKNINSFTIRHRNYYVAFFVHNQSKEFLKSYVFISF